MLSQETSEAAFELHGGKSKDGFFLCTRQAWPLKVQCFDFSVHCCDVKLATKLGTSLILRRAKEARPLLVSLIASRGILKITSDCLSRMISCYGQRLRKNASKSEKIRTLIRLPMVREALSEENLAKLEQLLSDLDAKRRKKCSEAEQDEEDEEGPEARLGSQ